MKTTHSLKVFVYIEGVEYETTVTVLPECPWYEVEWEDYPDQDNHVADIEEIEERLKHFAGMNVANGIDEESYEFHP